MSHGDSAVTFSVEATKGGAHCAQDYFELLAMLDLYMEMTATDPLKTARAYGPSPHDPHDSAGRRNAGGLLPLAPKPLPTLCLADGPRARIAGDCLVQPDDAHTARGQ